MARAAAMGPSATRRLLTRLGLEWELAATPSPSVRAARDQIETVVMPLGSYRNLTTLTAALFALHPGAIALNHGWVRLATKPSLDFFRAPDPQRLRRFIAAAVRLAQGGRRGAHGGSVLASHAFERPAPRQRYAARYGAQIVKPQLRCLFWKDSMAVLNHIWARRVDLAALTDALPQLRFLLPVRHPIDCAESVRRAGHFWAPLLDASDQPSRAAVLERLFDILLWFDQQRRQRPDKFLLFWEFDLHEDFLRALCAFSRLPFDAQWSRDVLSAIAVEPRIRSRADQEALSEIIDRRLGAVPDLAARARIFLEPVPIAAATRAG
ncbi:MAG: hypothetical protein SF182_27505 [Deltaproteobacteria bacterium]|nr:hypothetical protein [Deltaproteobacteria bacterium]